MSISPRSGTRGLKTLIWLKNYEVQKQQITFTLGLNAWENRKKSSSKRCFELNFLQKRQRAHMSTYTPEWSKGLNIIMYKNGNLHSL